MYDKMKQRDELIDLLDQTIRNIGIQKFLLSICSKDDCSNCSSGEEKNLEDFLEDYLELAQRLTNEIEEIDKLVKCN